MATIDFTIKPTESQKKNLALLVVALQAFDKMRDEPKAEFLKLLSGQEVGMSFKRADVFVEVMEQFADLASEGDLSEIEDLMMDIVEKMSEEDEDGD